MAKCPTCGSSMGDIGDTVNAKTAPGSMLKSIGSKRPTLAKKGTMARSGKLSKD